MRTWTHAFRSYVARKKITQLSIALEFGCAPSKVHGWMRGAYPRKDTRKRIERWSGGDIPAGLPRERAPAPVPPARRTGTDG